MYEMLLDEAVSKGILNRLKAKWQTENPEITDDVLELIANQFYGKVKGSKQIQKKIKDSGGKDSNLVSGFLLRHDGGDGKKPFNPNSLLDLTSYSWEQIVDLFDEFDINIGNIISQEDWVDSFLTQTLSKEERLQASKDLWSGNDEKVYDDGAGFRIYAVKNQKHCVAFGIYENYLAQRINGFNWCITTTNERSGYYNTYRNNGLTYYFVINETLPTDNKHHLSVIMPKEGYDTYEYTDLKNSGGNQTGLSLTHTNRDKCLTCIHPQLEGNEEALEIIGTKIPYDSRAELNISDGEVDPISRIVEREGDRFDFARRPKREKRALIMSGRYLLQLRSFKSMTPDLLALYIKNIRTEDRDRNIDGNWHDRFQSTEIFQFFASNKDLAEKLRIRLSGSEGDGPVLVDGREVTFGDIRSEFIKGKFSTKYEAVNNKTTTIKICTDERSENFGNLGIWDGEEGDWLTHKGIQYGPDYIDFEDSEWPSTGFFPSQDYKLDQEDEPEQNNEPEQNDEPSSDLDTDQVDDNEGGDVEDINEQVDYSKMFFVKCYSRSNSGSARDNFYTIHSTKNVANTPYVTIMSHDVWENKVKPIFRTAGEAVDTEEYEDDLTRQFKGKLN